MVREQPYGPKVDFWSLGVSIFQCYFGCHPFNGTTTEQIDHSILKSRIVFPKDNTLNFKKVNPTEAFLGFMQGLLNRDADIRFGIKEIKASPWMASMKWDRVHARKVPSAFVPNVRLRNTSSRRGD